MSFCFSLAINIFHDKQTRMANRNKKIEETETKKSVKLSNTIKETKKEISMPKFEDLNTGTTEKKSILNEQELTMSPTKKVINLFESLSKKPIMNEKPFNEQGLNLPDSVVIKSNLAPDIEKIIASNDNECEMVNENDLLDKPMATATEITLFTKDTEKNRVPEATYEATDIGITSKKLSYENEFIIVGEPNQKLIPELILPRESDYQFRPAPAEVTLAIEDANRRMETDARSKLKSIASADDIKEKIIEVLNSSYVADEIDHIDSIEDIDKLHEENIKSLNKILKIDTEDQEFKTEQGNSSMKEIEVMVKSYQANTSKQNTLDKKTVETMYSENCYKEAGAKSKEKTIYKITDLSDSKLLTIRNTRNTPIMSNQNIIRKQGFSQDQEFSNYNTEKILIDMAKREREPSLNTKINVVYKETKDENNVPHHGDFSRRFFCGCV